MISISTNACLQILLIFSLYILLLYNTCNLIEVNKILFTLNIKTIFIIYYCNFLGISVGSSLFAKALN